jgi:hypothetical protein
MERAVHLPLGPEAEEQGWNGQNDVLKVEEHGVKSGGAGGDRDNTILLRLADLGQSLSDGSRWKELEAAPSVCLADRTIQSKECPFAGMASLWSARDTEITQNNQAFYAGLKAAMESRSHARPSSFSCAAPSTPCITALSYASLSSTPATQEQRAQLSSHSCPVRAAVGSHDAGGDAGRLGRFQEAFQVLDDGLSRGYGHEMPRSRTAPRQG